MLNKRGQFYLIAALVIVGVLLGLATVYTSISPDTENKKVYVLSEEINYEISKLIDSSSSLGESEIQTRVQALLDHYSQSNPSLDIIAIHSSSTEVNFFFHEGTSLDRPKILIENSQVALQENSENTFSQTVPRSSDEISLTLSTDSTSEINLREGRTFIAILRGENDGNVFIALPENTQ